MINKIKQAKVVKQIDEDKFEIEVVDTDEINWIDTIQVAHDYVSFTGVTYLKTDPNLSSIKYRKDFSSNILPVKAELSFSIYDFYKFVLPYLNKHRFLQKKHAETLGAGDKINYSFKDQIFKYKNDAGEVMYAIKLKGEKEFSIVTENIYKKLVEPNLNYD